MDIDGVYVWYFGLEVMVYYVYGVEDYIYIIDCEILFWIVGV